MVSSWRNGFCFTTVALSKISEYLYVIHLHITYIGIYIYIYETNNKQIHW